MKLITEKTPPQPSHPGENRYRIDKKENCEEKTLSFNPIVIPPSPENPARYLVIMLHGWGADAMDLAPLASMLDLADCQFLFPNAPFDHPQVPGGRAWYALETSDYQGLVASRQQLHDWIISLEATTSIPLERTFLTGFSQGGAMTLDVGLSLPLAGLGSLSGYLHGEPHPQGPQNVLIVHGKQDPVVPIAAARQARDLLLGLGVNVEYHELNMGHEIPIPALTILRQFLRNRLETA